MAIEKTIPIPDILRVIEIGIRQRRGRGIRRLNSMVDNYLKLAADAAEDGVLEEHEEILLTAMAESIAAQFRKLSS